MQNCADWMKFGVGQSADILYVQSYAEVICDVETKISGRRSERDFTATVRDGSGFAD